MNEYIEDVIEIEKSREFSIGYGRQNPCMIILKLLWELIHVIIYLSFIFLLINYELTYLTF